MHLFCFFYYQDDYLDIICIFLFFFRPEGKRLRSKAELATYIEKNNLPFLPDEFIFRKNAYVSKLPMIEYNKDLA